MRRISAAIVLCSVAMMALGQEEGDGAPPKRTANKAIRQGMGTPPVIEVGENSIYVFMDGVLKRLDKKTLKALAEVNLEEQEEEGKDAFDQADKNGDGLLTPDEFPLVGVFIQRADANGDGALSRDEVPEQLLAAFGNKAMKHMMNGPAVIKLDKNDAAVFIYHNGVLYRLNGTSLQVEAKTTLAEMPENPLMMLMGGFGRRQDRGGERKVRPENAPEGAPEDFAPPIF